MLKIAIVGATGIVGQQAIVSLIGHPWFKIEKLVASERSADRKYIDALKDANGSSRWWCTEELPPDIAEMVVEEASAFDPASVDIIFSTMDASAAKELEPKYAKTTPVISTASTFRWEEDTPILVGGVNMDHAALLAVQQKNRGWKGLVSPKSNCTIAGLVVSLKPILDNFGVKQVMATSLQAMSGAGRTLGLSAMDMTENVVPYIPGEEAKVESEPLKILGKLTGGKIANASFGISATCTRVPVIDGHLVCATVQTERPCSPEDVKKAMMECGKDFADLHLPSSPKRLIDVTEDPFRPQPRVDRDKGGGMTVTVGRIRKDPVIENGIKYVCLAHNTKLGAAKGALQTAEYLVKNFLKLV
ncbi:MAG TPA: aspartate-semialdehyde dehydrogenase [Deltaproteobacteria bacterium]|nr:aspartate-semialdehyde dehydrogenase [Deltaproteobacteria bacterium]